MSEHEIREMAPDDRQSLAGGAKERRAEIMRRFSQQKFDKMHPDRQRELQTEIDLCNRTIAFVAYVRDTELAKE
jgi:hypothetical protein